MATLIDALLAVDDDKLTAKPTDTIEIPRLSKLTGSKFELTVTAIPPKRADEITNTCLKISSRGKFQEIDTTMLHVLNILDGVTSIDFNNKELKKKLHAATPKDVVLNLFTAGEIANIFNAIQKVSGFIDDEEEKKNEVKN